MGEPLFNWLKHRSAGLLCHVTSLPTDTGIGNIGVPARRLIDFIAAAKLKQWQICPLGPTGFGDSPYQAFSAFAGNPYLIDMHALVGLRLLDAQDLKPLQALARQRVDYGRLYQVFWPILEKAARKFLEKPQTRVAAMSFEEFRERESFWLEPYCWFQAFKSHFKGKPWFEWPKAQRFYGDAREGKLPKGFDKDEVERQAAYQYFFFAQWDELRRYAAGKGVEIMGDAPIFVARDSADVWAHPEYFQLDKDGQPLAVAGVPPDYFSKKGQLWGNPLYDWERLKQDGYAWWIERFKALFRLYDQVRIDHFRGFEDYWSVPADAQDARAGEWRQGPGKVLFEKLHAEMPEAKITAEDLGIVTDAVRALRDESGLPGMAVLQFAFVNDAQNPYLPHNMVPNQVVYTGTHDNDTSIGWYMHAPEYERHNYRCYLGTGGDSPNWDLIRTAYRSVARLCVVPLQDLMNLGREARLNTPGEAQGNWQWRFTAEQLDQLWRENAGYLAELARIYGR